MPAGRHGLSSFLSDISCATYPMGQLTQHVLRSMFWDESSAHADASLCGRTEPMRVCRAAACWVRQATQQCHAMSPRPCVVFITADSDEVCF